jgi:outer membrane receptor protein involved in Fe transport
MRQTFALRGRALATASFIGLACATATPAFAQPTNSEDEQPGQSETEIESGTQIDPAQPDSSGQVTVTGSRIRRPNVESNVPVTSVSAEELTSQGDLNIGDALNDLPAIRSTFSQANSTRFIGTAGVNVLDLRGLGTTRTLVLVNGRRHITYSPGDFLVDTNTIPFDLIERIDVVTGGSSAVYGSDAVAGVVNFVTRRDFEGLRLRGQSYITDQGDRGSYFASLTAGENFFDNRLNIAINLEYAHAEPLYLRQRDATSGAFSGRCQFNANDFTVGEPAAGDGIADLAFFCGVRNNAISDGGTLSANISAANCQNVAFGPGGANAAIGAARCLNPGTPFGQPRTLRFRRDGSLGEEIPAFDFRPFGSGNIISLPGTPEDLRGTTLRETGQIAPGLDRYTANLLARFDISPAFQPFLEAKYVRIDALQEGQPSFFQGGFAGFFGVGNDGAPRGIRCDNPFLTAQNLAALQAVGRCTGTTPAALGAETLPVGRFNIDFGGRSEVIRRETYRLVAGFGGEFNTDWNYELSFNYGRLESRQTQRNNLLLFDLNGNQAGFLLATDAVRNAQGQIVCRVNADANPANDAPGCVPINVFGEGQPSQAALDFVNTTSFVDSSATQYNVVGFINGDLSQLFELPGGPVRFVIGGEYRREEAFQQADPLSASGGTFFNAFQVFDPPPFEVIEAFGEIELPILRDVPFARELSVTGAARISDYNTAAGQTFAWNVNGTWAPTSDIRFRANYSKSVRVPTLGDLFTPETQNFAQIADPCSANRIGAGSPTREANCRALGVPVGFVSVFTDSQTAEIISSGNPFLEEEEGESLTLGAVFTPSFLPGFSLTVDYYDITVDNLIATLGAQTILNQCVDLPTIDNQFCQLIFPRQTVDDPATPFNDIGALVSPALRSGGVNFARLEAEGVDIEATYRRAFGDGWRLDLIGRMTVVIERNNFTSPTNPAFGTPQLLALGDPQLAANFNATITQGPVELTYRMNFIGEQLISGGIDTYFGFQGRPPTNADVTAERYYPDTFYHALRLQYRVNPEFRFYIGVDNLFDTQPPFGLLGNEGGQPFDEYGRAFYAGAQIDF